jgi:hypothetical protein
VCTEYVAVYQRIRDLVILAMLGLFVTGESAMNTTTTTPTLAPNRPALHCRKQTYRINTGQINKTNAIEHQPFKTE